jgi:hypothetical protein
VNVEDILYMLGFFGCVVTPLDDCGGADLSHFDPVPDGKVNIQDFLLVMAMFGSTCERVPRTSNANCVGDVCGTVTVVSTDGSGTTYQLGLDLSGTALNVYTIYGEEGYGLGLPAAY